MKITLPMLVLASLLTAACGGATEGGADQSVATHPTGTLGGGPQSTTPPIEVLEASVGLADAETYRNPIVGSPEVHAIHVYGGRTPHGIVEVTRKGHHVLVLMAYDGVDFTVTAESGAVVDRVILLGYGQLTAKVPAGTSVESHRAGPLDPDDLLFTCFPGPESNCDRAWTESVIAKVAGAPPLAYATTYRASEFRIHDDPPAPVAPPSDGTNAPR